MSTSFYISEEVLQSIELNIVNFRPERGGALLGPVGSNAITLFVYDQWASTTSASYIPSDELIALVPIIEAGGNLEFKGVIHSHPTGMDYPSSQDISGPFTKALIANKHMPFFLGPIVNVKVLGRSLDVHEVKCGQGKISFYAAYRGDSRTVVKPIVCEVLSFNNTGRKNDTSSNNSATKTSIAMKHFSDDLRKVADKLGNPNIFGDVFPLPYGDVKGFGTSINLNGKMELMLLAGESYPFTPPIASLAIIKEDGTQEEEQLQLKWRMDVPSEDRLLIAIQGYFRTNAPTKKAFGPNEIGPVTTNPDLAKLANWETFLVDDTPLVEYTNDLFKRSSGILSSSIFSKHVLVVGLGSVGSYISELFARSGVGQFTLIDPEKVEAVNLSRTVYTIEDIAQYKTDAMAKRLVNINPATRLTCYAKDLVDFTYEELDALILDVDLVVAATDSLNAQRILNRIAYFRKKPSLFIGIWAGAGGGEVIYVLPELTACYLCATRNRGDDELPKTDYTTGRLVSEIALAADIQHITSTAAKIGLSLLFLNDPSDASLKEFIQTPASSGNNFVAFGNLPNYWAFPELLSGAMVQYAFQSAWIRIPKHAECEVCGAERTEPTATLIKPPTREEILSILHQEPVFSELSDLTDEKVPETIKPPTSEEILSILPQKPVFPELSDLTNEKVPEKGKTAKFINRIFIVSSITMLIFVVLLNLLWIHFHSDCGLGWIVKSTNCVLGTTRVGFPLLVWENNVGDHRTYFNSVALMIDVLLALITSSFAGFALQRFFAKRAESLAL
ncbi:MAG: hypothetical protein C4583_07290 [Anaerolineaceae bacterium]|nr:MAG: hypothetical protein C4583_07290 [Anaerolineaceae bacterium]